MRTTFPMLPDTDALLALEPEEVACLILEHLNWLERGNWRSQDLIQTW